MDFKTNTSFNIANTSSQEDFDDDYILIKVMIEYFVNLLLKILKKKLVLIYEKINVLLFLILVLFKRIGIVPNLLVIIKTLKKLEKL